MASLKYDLHNKKFGMLFVVSRFKSTDKGTKWYCRCDCGKEIIVYAHNLYNNKTKSCGCTKAKLIHDTHYLGTKDVSGTYMKELRTRARKKNLDFNLTAEFLQRLLEEQNYKCAITGVKIKGSPNNRNKKSNTFKRQTASVDRINSSCGYTEDNVQWVHKRINNMKGNLSTNMFQLWCLRVIYYAENTRKVYSH